jgi:hypothetical protein
VSTSANTHAPTAITTNPARIWDANWLSQLSPTGVRSKILVTQPDGAHSTDGASSPRGFPLRGQYPVARELFGATTLGGTVQRGGP